MSVPFYLIQGSIVFFSTPDKAEFLYGRVMDAFRDSGKLDGFLIATSQPNTPWLIRELGVVVAGIRQLPPGFRSFPDMLGKNDCAIICADPPIVTGNNIRDFGLSWLHNAAIAIENPPIPFSIRA